MFHLRPRQGPIGDTTAVAQDRERVTERSDVDRELVPVLVAQEALQDQHRSRPLRHHDAKQLVAEAVPEESRSTMSGCSARLADRPANRRSCQP